MTIGLFYLARKTGTFREPKPVERQKVSKQERKDLQSAVKNGEKHRQDHRNDCKNRRAVADPELYSKDPQKLGSAF